MKLEFKRSLLFSVTVHAVVFSSFIAYSLRPVADTPTPPISEISIILVDASLLEEAKPAVAPTPPIVRHEEVPNKVEPVRSLPQPIPPTPLAVPAPVGSSPIIPANESSTITNAPVGAVRPAPALIAENSTQPVSESYFAPRPAKGVQTKARPNYRNNPEPDYPAAARRRAQEGLVVLTVSVDAQGRVREVKLFKSSGFAALDKAALEAVNHWEFEPARLDGEPVASEVEVPVRFTLAR